MTLKELKSFMKLCREQGIESIKFDNVEIHFGSMPIQTPKRKVSNSITGQLSDSGFIGVTNEMIPTPDALTEEDMLFYSATGQTPEAN